MTLRSVLDQMAKSGQTEDVRWKCLSYLLKVLLQIEFDLDYDPDTEDK